MLPNRQEFVARLRNAEALPTLSLVRILVGCLYFIPAFAYLGFYEWYIRGRVSAGWSEILGYGFLVLLFVPGIILLRRFSRWDDRRVRECEMTCPNCNRRLTGVLGSIAVASGRCGGCGAQVHSGDEVV
jgi:hypothetical protein